MPVNVLFSARPALWPVYEPLLTQYLAEAGVQAEISTDFEPDQVDYVVYAPNGGLLDFSPFTRLKAVLSLWAGVEKIADNDTLSVPLARMVDHGLTRGHDRMGHRPCAAPSPWHGSRRSSIRNRNGVFAPDAPPLARDRNV